MQTSPSNNATSLDGKAADTVPVVALVQHGNGIGQLGDLKTDPRLLVIGVADEAALGEAVIGAKPAAVVIDLSIVDGWPLPAAERLLGLVAGRAPVVFLNDSQADANVIEHRLGSPSVSAQPLSSLTLGSVTAILRGLIATWNAAGAARR